MRKGKSGKAAGRANGETFKAIGDVIGHTFITFLCARESFILGNGPTIPGRESFSPSREPNFPRREPNFPRREWNFPRRDSFTGEYRG